MKPFGFIFFSGKKIFAAFFRAKNLPEKKQIKNGRKCPARSFTG